MSVPEAAVVDELKTVANLRRLRVELNECISRLELPFITVAAPYMESLEHCGHADIAMGARVAGTVYFEWEWCRECGMGGAGAYVPLEVLAAQLES